MTPSTGDDAVTTLRATRNNAPDAAPPPLDCRSEEGVTVGLVDALISVARVLARRDLTPHPVREALADLRSDEDLAAILSAELAT